MTSSWLTRFVLQRDSELLSESLGVASHGFDRRICRVVVLQAGNRRPAHASTVLHVSKAQTLCLSFFLQDAKCLTQFCTYRIMHPLAPSRFGDDFVSLGFESLVQLPVSATLRGTEHTLNPLCFSHHVPTSPGDFESRDWVHGGFVDQVINAREILARRRVPEGDRATCSAALSRAVRLAHHFLELVHRYAMFPDVSFIVLIPDEKVIRHWDVLIYCNTAVRKIRWPRDNGVVSGRALP